MKWQDHRSWVLPSIAALCIAVVTGMFTVVYSDYYAHSHRIVDLSWASSIWPERILLSVAGLVLGIVGITIWRTVRLGRATILEKAYFNYRNATVEDFNSSQTSRALALRYNCEPLRVGDQAFPVTLLWENKDRVIHPDEILGTLDPFLGHPFARSPILNRQEYAAARRFVKSILEASPIKYEGYEYCMTRIELSGALPRIEGKIGYYYDHILTQYAIAWELKKALKEHGFPVLSHGGHLPLRDAVEIGGNPLINANGRCAAMSVSMLMVFERPEQGGFWTVLCRRSRDVASNAGLIGVVPAGMFEVKNTADQWSVQAALWREMLEEAYGEVEEQGNGVPNFEDYLTQKEPLRTLSKWIKRKQAEFSIPGICCDLTNLQIEICTALYVRGASLGAIRPMKVNWEYDLRGNTGSFGTPWNQIAVQMGNTRVGEITPTAAACIELGRNWALKRHGI